MLILQEFLKVLFSKRITSLLIRTNCFIRFLAILKILETPLQSNLTSHLTILNVTTNSLMSKLINTDSLIIHSWNLPWKVAYKILGTSILISISLRDLSYNLLRKWTHLEIGPIDFHLMRVKILRLKEVGLP